jgi:uncharacterized UBP type Zn finger protein
MDAITDRFAGYEQRDAHEFMGELVDRVHDELEEEQKKRNTADDRRASGRLPTDDFRMTVQKVLKCESCGYERYERRGFIQMHLFALVFECFIFSHPLFVLRTLVP